MILSEDSLKTIHILFLPAQEAVQTRLIPNDFKKIYQKVYFGDVMPHVFFPGKNTQEDK